MRIVEEVTAWELGDRLWGQGKENYMVLVRHYKDDDFVELCEEAQDEWDLGELNDWLAYDFDNVCEELGVVRMIDDSEIVKWLYENADGETLTHAEITEQAESDWSWNKIMEAIDDFRNRHEDVWDVESWIEYDEDDFTVTCDFDRDNIIYNE